MEKTMGPVHERIHTYWLSGGIVMLAPSFVGARIEMCWELFGLELHFFFDGLNDTFVWVM
jgi:hypothetical protein